MTSRVDLQEFLGAYLAEVEEHLAMARARLLVVDEELRATPPTSAPRELRDAFRAIHTIKGLSAMVGIDAVEAVAHRMETVLRTADRSGTTSPQAVELLLRGLSAIERAAAALSRGEKEGVAAPADLLSALEKLDSDARRADGARAARAASASPAKPRLGSFFDSPLAAKLAAFERDLLSKGSRSGKLALRADFQPSAEKAKRGITITKVREELAAFTEIVKVLPLSDPASSTGAGLRFAILLLAEQADEERVAAVLEAGAGDVQKLLLDAAEEGSASASDAPASPATLDTSGGAAADFDDSPFDRDDDQDRAGLPLRRNLLRVDVARIDDAMEKLAMLVVTRSRFARELADLNARGVSTVGLSAVAQDNARQLRDLRAALLRVRMVPIGEVLDRLPLIVRGLRRSTGKNVHLDLRGTDEELDKAISERLFPALLHLVRNAVDHGLETPDERLRAKKPVDGLVRVSCSSRTNRQLEIVVSDDGRGIDRAAVARKAGVTSGGQLSDRELLDLLCRPGLSTKQEVTTTSGRGMGMDIVRRSIEEIGGELSLKTEPGKGTRFTLTAPLTLTIVDAFIFRCAGERFVVPVGTIEEIVEVDVQTLQRPPSIGGSGGSLFQRRGEAVTLFHLARALSLPETSESSIALVVRRGGDAVAFAVDRVIGQQETVVRPLRDPLVQVPGVAGTTDLGDGRATLVLDLGALATARERAA